jgi:hypothetical protein
MPLSPWPSPSHVPCCRDTDEDHDEPSHLVAVSAAARRAAAGLFDLAPTIPVTITLYRAGLPSAIVIAASICSRSSLIRQVKGAKVEVQCR